MKTAGLLSLSQLLATALKPWRAARGFRSSDHGEQRLWSTWHRMYDENEHLQARLQVVRQTIREILDSYPRGKIRLISICSGDGRDILEEISKHPRRIDLEVRYRSSLRFLRSKSQIVPAAKATR